MIVLDFMLMFAGWIDRTMRCDDCVWYFDTIEMCDVHRAEAEGADPSTP